MNVDKLNELADLLESQQHYNQRYFFEGREVSCASPACALGHWASAHPDTWESVIPRWAMPDHNNCVIPRLIASPSLEPLCASELEFGITEDESILLFDSDGCGCAKDGPEAAAFIRRFIRGEETVPEPDYYED